MKKRSKYRHLKRKRQNNFCTRFCFFLKNSVVVSTLAIILFFVFLSCILKLDMFNDYESVSTSSETKESQSIQIIDEKEAEATFAEDEKVVSVVNDSPPVILLDGDEEIKVDSIENYAEPGFSAFDEEDGDLTEKVNIVENQLDEYNYEICYSVSDTTGNVAEKTRKVKIVVGVVCLTFDDGPSLEITPQILDILKEKEVNATFFVIGFDEENEIEKVNLIKRENDEGHVIGLHGMVHSYSIYSDIDTLMNNFYQIKELVADITGNEAKFIRFPGGTSNTISENYCEGIMTQAVQRVTEEGYIYVDWNVDSNDAGGNNVPSEEIYNNVINNLKPGRVNVVLMHDGATKQTTVDALSDIIDYCQMNGYDIEPLSTDMSISSSQHHPNN